MWFCDATGEKERRGLFSAQMPGHPPGRFVIQHFLIAAGGWTEVKISLRCLARLWAGCGEAGPVLGHTIVIPALAIRELAISSMINFS